MKLDFSNEEGRVLHGLIEDAAGDIVVRLDSAGFINHASANAAQLGIDLSALLLMPHISDFADPDYAADMARYVTKVLGGAAGSGWFEFPIRQAPCQIVDEHEGALDDPIDLEREVDWYALNLRLIDDDDGAPQGALGLLRSIQQKHSLEVEINARALTDPLTGLANRHAFCAELRRSLSHGNDDAMAVFAVDGVRAIFMQYGQRTADEIQWGFAKFLETMTLRGHALAQLDTERFGVLLSGMSMREARVWADDVLKTFAGLAVATCGRGRDLSASAGLTKIETNVDWTLRQAELGLVMARAGGGSRVGVGSHCTKAASGKLKDGEWVEGAMEAAIVRAQQSQI